MEQGNATSSQPTVESRPSRRLSPRTRAGVFFAAVAASLAGTACATPEVPAAAPPGYAVNQNPGYEASPSADPNANSETSPAEEPPAQPEKIPGATIVCSDAKHETLSGGTHRFTPIANVQGNAAAPGIFTVVSVEYSDVHINPTRVAVPGVSPVEVKPISVPSTAYVYVFNFSNDPANIQPQTPGQMTARFEIAVTNGSEEQAQVCQVYTGPNLKST